MVVDIVLILIVVQAEVQLLEFRLFSSGDTGMFCLIVVLTLFPPVSVDRTCLCRTTCSVVSVDGVDSVGLVERECLLPTRRD